jgi:hypothetical protein
MANHCAMVPETALFNAPMNATNTTAGGYIGSNMYNSVIPAVATGIRNAFGDAHVIKFRQLLPNAFTSASEGTAKNLAWVDAYCNLMNEVQIYGCRVFNHNVFEVGCDKTQFPIFLAKPELCTAYRQYATWLRNVSDYNSTPSFANAYTDGRATYDDASHSHGVRPFFLLK